MCLKFAPDFAQQIMEQILCGLDNIKVYLDYVGVFGTTLDEQQVLLDSCW